MKDGRQPDSANLGLRDFRGQLKTHGIAALIMLATLALGRWAVVWVRVVLVERDIVIFGGILLMLYSLWLAESREGRELRRRSLKERPPKELGPRRSESQDDD